MVFYLLLSILIFLLTYYLSRTKPLHISTKLTFIYTHTHTHNPNTYYQYTSIYIYTHTLTHTRSLCIQKPNSPIKSISMMSNLCIFSFIRLRARVYARYSLSIYFFVLLCVSSSSSDNVFDAMPICVIAISQHKITKCPHIHCILRAV